MRTGKGIRLVGFRGSGCQEYTVGRSLSGRPEHLCVQRPSGVLETESPRLRPGFLDTKIVRGTHDGQTPGVKLLVSKLVDPEGSTLFSFLTTDQVLAVETFETLGRRSIPSGPSGLRGWGRHVEYRIAGVVVVTFSEVQPL